jgi:hypothetical protein
MADGTAELRRARRIMTPSDGGLLCAICGWLTVYAIALGIVGRPRDGFWPLRPLDASFWIGAILLFGGLAVTFAPW